MIRIILGIIVGFVVWSILWVGSDQVLIATMGWYGEHQHGFGEAMKNGAPFTANTTILIMNIVRSIIVSLVAGYVTAIVARENRWSTAILGILLLLFGIMVEIIAWSYLPLWYHLLFLLLLVPVTIAGGRMKKFA